MLCSLEYRARKSTNARYLKVPVDEVLALIACVRAADAMRGERNASTYIPVQAMRDYDAARARLAAP